MRPRVRILVVIAILGAVARADPPAPPRVTDPSGDPASAPPLVLDPGAVIARATVATDARDTIAIEPDVWLGATDRLTLGATSSDEARGWVGASRGACVRACDARFGGAAADARFRLRDGDVQVAGRAALDFRGFGPGVVALELGLGVRSRAGALTVTAAPYVSLGIVNASLDNHVGAVVPLALAWDLGPARLGARAAVRGDLDGFLATAQLALAASIEVAVSEHVAIGAGAGAPRSAELHVEWRN
jgi:hypothetical protein